MESSPLTGDWRNTFTLAMPSHRTTEASAVRVVCDDRGPDADEFAALYERHRAPLLLFCLSRTHDPALAEDIVQDVFETAFSLWSRFDRSRPFWPWIASIAARDCLDAHRRRAYAATRIADLARADTTEPIDTTATTVLARQWRDRLQRHVRALPARQRAALQLFALDGYSYGEIAEQLGCTVATVKGLIVRARTRLRELGARGVVAAFGTGRALRSRWRHVADRLPVAVAAYGEILGAWMRSLSAGAAAKAAVVVVTTALVVPVAGGGSTDAVERRTPVRAHRPDTSSADPTPEPSPSTPPPVTTPTKPTEPVFRQHTGHAERVANDALTPLLYRGRAYSALKDAFPNSMVVSPGYERDRTIFVAGSAFEVGEAQPLFVTHDGGASWAQRRAIGLGSGARLSLPPAYPDDDRIFAVSWRGVQVSRDGGETFETIVAMPGIDAFTLSPGFDTGDPIAFLTVGGRLLEYHDDTGLVHPVSLGGGFAHHVAVSAGYAVDYPADPRILVGTRVVGVGEVWVLRCTRTPGPPGATIGALSGPSLACDGSRLSDRDAGELDFRLSRRLGRGVVYVRAGDGTLYRSSDDGRTFEPEPASSEEGGYSHVFDVDVLPSPSDGSVIVARYSGMTASASEWRARAPLVRTDDGGRTWQPVRVDTPELVVAHAVRVTPTGRIIVVGDTADSPSAIACSVDGGRTWAGTCPTPDTA